jgi:diadenylate cyclase
MPSWLQLPGWIGVPGWLDFLDIALVAVFGWLTIRYLRRTRAQSSLAGLALLVIVYFFARSFDLRLTAALFQAFFAVVVLVLVVVFQEDLKRVFEQLGTWRRGLVQVPEETGPLDLLARTAARLAATKTGALIVVPGREPIDRHLEGGVALGGRLSEPLLLSIFDASSPGHDGAVILRGGTVERFAVHLPLSANHSALGPGGTRHAAALGLAERCDATCIVVSEERGTVSLARDGALRALARPEELAAELQAAFKTEPQVRRWWQGRAGVDAAVATVGAVVLWMVLIPGSDVSEATVAANVEITNLPTDLALESIEPTAVDVTLRGLSRDLVLVKGGGVTVHVDAYLAQLGRRTFTITPEDVHKPDALAVIDLDSDKVRISVTSAPEAARPEGS